MSKLPYIVFTMVLMLAQQPMHATDPASLHEDVYTADNVAAADTFAPGELRLKVNSLLFMQDDEFSTPAVKGYTLPGFRLRASVAWKPVEGVSIEGGVYGLRYWGTDDYPCMAYRDIGYWDGTGKGNKGFHLLPMLRARLNTPFGLTVVLGTLYGGQSHRLIEPLYTPELNLTADPEAGLQLLYKQPRVSADMWVNWESFIYHGDTHQEAFVFGISGTVDYTRPTAPVRVYTPASLLVQHRGGEIDTLLHNSMQTLMNASIGLGISHNFRRSWLGEVDLQGHFLAYKQVAGNIWPYDSGTAWYVTASARMRWLRARVGWMHADKFISLMGYPLFGTVAATSSQEVYGTSTTLFAGVEYAHTFAPGYTLGVMADIYYQPSSTGLLPSGEYNPYKATNNIVVGIFFRISQSWLLKRFGKK